MKGTSDRRHREHQPTREALTGEAEGWNLVERIRWREGTICPHCGTINRAYFLEPKDGPLKTRTGKESARRVLEVRGMPHSVLQVAPGDPHALGGKNGEGALELQ